MRALKKLYTILALGLAMPLACIGPAGATVFEVKIDASGLLTDAVMAFVFTDSDSDPDPEADRNHQLHIWDFASHGTLSGSSATGNPDKCDSSPPPPFGPDPCKDPAGSSVTGTLGQDPPVTVTISDTPPPGTLEIAYYHTITPPVAPPFHISFKFEMSGDPGIGGGSPDGFAFWLLDPASGFPLVPPDPSGALVLYTFGGTCDAIEEVATCTEVPSIPEPTPVTLAAAALLALICARCAAAASHRRGATRV